MRRDENRDFAPIAGGQDRGIGSYVSYGQRETPINNEESEPSLLDYINVLKKRLGLILGTALVFFGIAAVYCAITPSQYTAGSTVELRGYAPVLAGVQSETLFGSDTRRIEYTKTTVAKLKLQGLADEILSKNDLAAVLQDYRAEHAGIFARLINKIRATLGFEKGPGSRDSAGLHFVHSPGAINGYLKHIDIKPIHETNLVVINATTADRALSQRLANAHATGFIDHLQRERQESSEANLHLLRRQAKELKERVTAAEQALADYAEKNKLLALSEDQASSMAVKQVEGLASMLAEATGRRVKSESLLTEVKARSAEDSSVLDDDTTRQMRLTLKQAETEYATLSQRVTPAFPAMVELKAKIDSLRKILQEEKKRISRGLQSQFETDRSTEEKLRGQIEQEKSVALDMNKRLIQFNVLTKEATSLRELYQQVLRQVKEIEISASSSTSNVFVSDYATLPSTPSAPKTGLILTIFALLGLGIGFIASFILESFDQTLKSSDEVRSSLDLPILGAIPQFVGAKFEEERSKPRMLTWKRDPKKGTANGDTPPPPAALTDAPSRVPRKIFTVSAPGDAVSEALRTIRAGILLSSADNPPRVVMITSATKGDGKTTIVSNLAATLAQASHRTLVIDGDLRMRQLTKVFHEDHASNTRGLSELLTGQAALDQVLHRTAIPGLDVLPAGSKAPNPAELLGSHAMRQLIQDLTKRYDYILLDSPPILPVADALMLSRLVDSVVLVVRSRKTERKLAQEARRRLIRVNARVLGVVLNDVNPNTSDEYDLRVYDGYIETLKTGNA